MFLSVKLLLSHSPSSYVLCHDLLLIWRGIPVLTSFFLKLYRCCSLDSIWILRFCQLWVLLSLKPLSLMPLSLIPLFSSSTSASSHVLLPLEVLFIHTALFSCLWVSFFSIPLYVYQETSEREKGRKDCMPLTTFFPACTDTECTATASPPPPVSRSYTCSLCIWTDSSLNHLSVRIRVESLFLSLSLSSSWLQSQSVCLTSKHLDQIIVICSVLCPQEEETRNQQTYPIED